MIAPVGDYCAQMRLRGFARWAGPGMPYHRGRAMKGGCHMAWKYLAFALIAITVAVTGTVASAQQPTAAPPAAKPEAPAPTGAEKGAFAACRADVASLCKDVPSGMFGRLQCLKTNQDKLSPACIGSIRSMLGAVQAKVASPESAPRPLKACAQDLAALCPDISAEGGRVKCLRDNSPKLSTGCSESIKAIRAQAQDALKACEADRKRLCPGSGDRTADQLKCLRERTAELGAGCRDLVAVAKQAKSKTVSSPDSVPPGAPPTVTRSLAPPASQAPPPPPAASPKW